MLYVITRVKLTKTLLSFITDNLSFNRYDLKSFLGYLYTSMKNNVLGPQMSMPLSRWGAACCWKNEENAICSLAIWRTLA